MQKTILTLPEIKLVGITARTNNVSEMNPKTAKIAPTIQKYLQNAMYEKIPNRKEGKTYCVYTEYESDFNGDYTYFIGAAVESFGELPEGYVEHIIPAQDYAKFTNDPGPMPLVCINMWQKIWQMSPQGLGGKRNYLSDFELYDERAANPLSVVLDIHIGIGK